MDSASGSVSSWSRGRVAGYAKHVERVEAAKRADATPSEYVGTVKVRQTITATVEAVRYIDGDYGTTTLLIMREVDGPGLFKWFASGSLTFEVGQVVTGKATVKGHEEYQGRKQTTVSRCKLDVVPAT